MSDREIVTRRDLPHWYMPHAAHFVTYRLAGTIPVGMLKLWRESRDALLRGHTGNSSVRERAHKQFFANYDHYLDEHRGLSWLSRVDVATAIRENLYHHHREKYHLMAYCIMPNHVHVLLQPRVDDGNEALSLTGDSAELTRSNFRLPADETADVRSPLATIMHSLKSYTANAANKLIGRQGQFWQHESFDHWVRDDDELERIVNYIRQNPVAAGLVTRPENWKYSSAHDRHLFDGDQCGWLTDDAAHSQKLAVSDRPP